MLRDRRRRQRQRRARSTSTSCSATRRSSTRVGQAWEYNAWAFQALGGTAAQGQLGRHTPAPSTSMARSRAMTCARTSWSPTSSRGGQSDAGRASGVRGRRAEHRDLDRGLQPGPDATCAAVHHQVHVHVLERGRVLAYRHARMRRQLLRAVLRAGGESPPASAPAPSRRPDRGHAARAVQLARARRRPTCASSPWPTRSCAPVPCTSACWV